MKNGNFRRLYLFLPKPPKIAVFSTKFRRVPFLASSFIITKLKEISLKPAAMGCY
jgi:hypothetical protein